MFIPIGTGGLDSPRGMVFRGSVVATGDLNCDGSVDGFDIDPFVELLTGS
jgi:hypothetical protein